MLIFRQKGGSDLLRISSQKVSRQEINSNFKSETVKLELQSGKTKTKP